MVSQLEFMSNWMDLGICLRWRGRVRLEPCQIGSTRPRRQARGRRSLHPFKSIRFDMFHSLTNMWRFGFGVRENVGKGKKEKGARPCTARPSFTMFFQNVFHSAVLEPTHHCDQKKKMKPLSTSVECRIRLTTPGVRGGLSHSPKLTGRLHNQSPCIFFPLSLLS